MDVLDERYARGEIDREDYLQRKDDLIGTARGAAQAIKLQVARRSDERQGDCTICVMDNRTRHIYIYAS